MIRIFKRILHDFRHLELIPSSQTQRNNYLSARQTSYRAEPPLGFRSRGSHSYFVR
ncbi:hypothetical protein KBC99_01075 [Candidatus Saccharibacteria bacterium]|nr:hypothetical protein [Candidatus Saccharibacteria bacterium]